MIGKNGANVMCEIEGEDRVVGTHRRAGCRTESRRNRATYRQPCEDRRDLERGDGFSPHGYGVGEISEDQTLTRAYAQGRTDQSEGERETETGVKKDYRTKIAPRDNYRVKAS